MTITPSTSGSRSISAMPASGPATKTPVDSTSATTAVLRDDGHAAGAARRLAEVRIQQVVVADAVLA